MKYVQILMGLAFFVLPPLWIAGFAKAVTDAIILAVVNGAS